jgi:hypothetical protein
VKFKQVTIGIAIRKIPEAVNAIQMTTTITIYSSKLLNKDQ